MMYPKTVKLKFKNYLLIFFFSVLTVPVTYLIFSLILMSLSVNKITEKTSDKTYVYLNTNGVHLDIILKKEDISKKLKDDLNIEEKYKFISFAWGDEYFYINSPEWKDLTFKTASIALFLKSPALIHLTKHTHLNKNWIKIAVSLKQLLSLNTYIENSFVYDKNDQLILLEGKGYFSNDDFFKAQGSYTMFYTCNTWANNAFKESDLKACLWTPFDIGLINKYKK